MDDDFGIGDDEDFGFEVPGVGHETAPHAAAGSMDMPPFPAVGGDGFDDAMLPEDSGLLFDEIGVEPAQASPIATLAATNPDELPPSRRVENGTIRGKLGDLLTLKMRSRFPKKKQAGAADAVQAAAPEALQPGAAGPSTPARPAAPLSNGDSSMQRADSMATAASPTQSRAQGFPNSLAPGAWKTKVKRSQAWTQAETTKFYEALQQFGTNFALLTMMFPGRDRVDIVRKFHHEQRVAPHQVRSALDPDNEQAIDVEAFKRESHEWARKRLLNESGPLGDEDNELLRELETTENAPPRPQPTAEGAEPGNGATAAPSSAAAVDVPLGAIDDAVMGTNDATDSFAIFGDENDDDRPFAERAGFSNLVDDPEDDVPFGERPGYAELLTKDEGQGKGGKKPRGKRSSASPRLEPNTVPAPAADDAPAQPAESAVGAAGTAEVAAGDDYGFDFDLDAPGADFLDDD